MYAIKGNEVQILEVKNVIPLAGNLDPGIQVMETVVATYFNTSVHELNVFYKDTEAKIMCCFLLHDVLSYNVGSLAKKYQINRLFLRNKITEIYKNCLQNEADMQHVIALRSAFFCDKKLIN